MALKNRLRQIRNSMDLNRRNFFNFFPSMKYSTYCNIERSDSTPKMEDAYDMFVIINRELEKRNLQKVHWEDIWYK